MEYNVQKTHARILMLFWINIVFFIAVFITLLFVKNFHPISTIYAESERNILFEQYAIIFTLGGIPFALKLFHSQYKKIKLLDNNLLFIRKYTLAYILRIVILDLIILMNFICFYLFDSHNFIYMALITLFAVFFCYPNIKTLSDNELGNKDITN